MYHASQSVFFTRMQYGMQPFFAISLGKKANSSTKQKNVPTTQNIFAQIFFTFNFEKKIQFANYIINNEHQSHVLRNRSARENWRTMKFEVAASKVNFVLGLAS